MKRIVLASSLFAVLAAVRSEAYIEALYPMKQVLDETEVIVEGVIEKVDPKNRIFTVKTGKVLKGKNPYEVVRVNVGVGQDWHPAAVMPHAVEGIPTLLLYNGERKGILYMNKFFIQVYGDAGAEPAKAWWTMTHIEIRMNRTFAGTVPELSKLLGEILSGKKKAPEPNANVAPWSRQSVAKLPKATKTGDPEPVAPPDPNEAHKVFPLNAEGFVLNWLVLGPIGVGAEGANHTEAGQKAIFDKEWLPKRAEIRPKDQEKVKAGDAELVWQAGEAADFYLDFGAAENSMTLALTYLWSENDVPEAVLLIGSDDSSRFVLNGKEVLRVYEGRGVAKDQNKAAVALKKGLNVLLMEVINGGGPTGGCARLVDQAGTPLKGVVASCSPTPKVDKK